MNSTQTPGELAAEDLYSTQLNPGHIEKSDAVQIAFLLLVAGNATMVNMINLVNNDPSVPNCVPIADSGLTFLSLGHRNSHPKSQPASRPQIRPLPYKSLRRRIMPLPHWLRHGPPPGRKSRHHSQRQSLPSFSPRYSTIADVVNHSSSKPAKASSPPTNPLTATKTSSLTPIPSTCIGSVALSKLWGLGLESISVWLSGLRVRSWRLCLVRLFRDTRCEVCLRLIWWFSNDFPGASEFETGGSV